MLYNSTSSYFPGRLTTAAENNLVAQMWAYARPYSKVSEAAEHVEHLRQREPRRAGRELLLPGRADLQAPPRLRQPGVRRPHRRSRSSTRRGTTTGATTSTSAPSAGCSSRTARRPTHGLHARRRSSTSTTSPTTRCCARRRAWSSTSTSPTTRSSSCNDVWGGPKSRSYPADSYDGANDSMTNLGKLLFGSASSDRRRQPRADARDQRLLPAAGRRDAGARTAPAWGATSTSPGARAYGVELRPTRTHDWHVNPTQERPRLRVLHARATSSGTTELWPNDSAHRAEQPEPLAGHHVRHAARAIASTRRPRRRASSPCNDAFLSIQYKNTLITEKRRPAASPRVRTKATLVYFPAQPRQHRRAQRLDLRDAKARRYVAVRPAIGTYHWLTAGKNKAANGRSGSSS